MIRVYIRGRKHPFTFQQADRSNPDGDYVYVKDGRPSDRNPYVSRTPQGQQGVVLAYFPKQVVDAVVFDGADHDDEED